MPEASPPGLLPRAVSLRLGGLGVALALVITGVAFAWAALLLDFGTARLPGPGFFPFALGLLLAAAAIVIAAGIVRERSPDETVELGHRDVLIGFGALLAVGPAFELLGAYLTLGALAAALLIFIGRVPVVRAVPAAALGMAAVWWFFKQLLGLQLPAGPFF